MNPDRLSIVNGKIITPYEVLDQRTLLITGSTITAVSDTRVDMPGAVEIDAKGKYVSPGFIDIHVHGGAGHDFTDGTETAFLKIAELHAGHGTTSMPSMKTSSKLSKMAIHLPLISTVACQVLRAKMPFAMPAQ